MIYKFKSPIGAAAEAQPVGEALERLRTVHGNLRNEDIVDAARITESPLHKFFTWDDARAAEKFRLAEAGTLVRNIVVVEEDSGDEVRAFWPVRVKESDAPEQRYYQAAAVIQRNPLEYESAMKTMLTELAGAEISLGQLQRLAPKAMHPVIKKASAHVLHAHGLLQNANASPPA